MSATARVHGLAFLWARAPSAVVAVGLSGLAVTGAVIATCIGSDSVGETIDAVVFAGALVLCTTLGALILAGLPRHGLGVALLTGGLLGSAWALAVPLAERLPELPPVVVRWAAWVENWAFAGLLVLLTWPLLLFPDGRVPSRRWRPFAWLLGVGLVAITLHGMLDPGVLDSADTVVPVANPLGVPESWGWVEAVGVAGFGLPVGAVTSVVAVTRRTAGAADAPTRATRWAAWLIAANFVLWVALAAAGSALVDGWLYATTFTAAVGAFALAASFALLRHRVVAVDQLLRRALISTGVSAIVVAGFAVVFAVTTAVAGDGPAVVLGSLAAVAVASATHARIRRRVDAALWGHGDAGVALGRVQAELDGAGDPATALAGLAAAVADALGAGWARITPAATLGLPPAVAGRVTAAPAYVRDLHRRGTPVGRLEIGGRGPDEPFGPRDVELADLLAGHLNLALDALGLAAQLRHSRGAIVTAREEERRRIRRDLHDELGPTLAGVALTLEAAQRTGGDDAGRLVREAREQAQAVVGDVRRIVHGLRPPILDELGLGAALRAYGDRLRPLEVTVDVPDDGPERSAAAEIALYRIATEALTNVVRHASARRAEVALRSDSAWIELRVQDDGAGFPSAFDPGVGLRSMRERAAELEGTLTVGAGADGGVLILARLPRGS